MTFTSLSLEGAFIIQPEINYDVRGSFYRFFDSEEFKKIGHKKPWIQLNHSYTKSKFTIRGLHFQLPPHAEIKMVKCIKGRIFDVIVDLRKDSSTFLKWAGVQISAENGQMIYIPEGFAHGFQTLSDDCELIYHHTAAYSKDSEGGVKWDDPSVNIQWPSIPLFMSDRDQQHPLISRQFSGIKL